MVNAFNQLVRCQYVCVCTSKARKLSTSRLAQERLLLKQQREMASMAQEIASLKQKEVFLSLPLSLYVCICICTHTHTHTHTHTNVCIMYVLTSKASKLRWQA